MNWATAFIYPGNIKHRGVSNPTGSKKPSTSSSHATRVGSLPCKSLSASQDLFMLGSILIAWFFVLFEFPVTITRRLYAIPIPSGASLIGRIASSSAPTPPRHPLP